MRRDEFGIDISEQQPKHLDVYMGQSFDRVITQCDRVKEVCPEFPGAPRVHFRNDVVRGPGGSQILVLDPSANVVELFQPAG